MIDLLSNDLAGLDLDVDHLALELAALELLLDLLVEDQALRGGEVRQGLDLGV